MMDNNESSEMSQQKQQVSGLFDRVSATFDHGRPPIAEWMFGVSGADLEWMQSKLTPHPLKTLTTPIALSNPSARSIPRTFIPCAEDSSEDEIRAEERRCIQSDWKYQAISTDHDAMITLPDKLAKILIELTR